MAKKQKIEPVAPDQPVDETIIGSEDKARLAQIHHQRDLQAQAAAVAEELSAKDRENMVQITRVIDPHEGRLATVRTYWVPLTPTLCIECGYDAAIAIGFVHPDPSTGKNGWESIPETLQFDSTRSVRDFALQTLEMHKAAKHPVVDNQKVKTREQIRADRRRREVPQGFITNPKL